MPHSNPHYPVFPAGSPLDHVQRALEAVIAAQDAALADPEVRSILSDAGVKLALLKCDRDPRAKAGHWATRAD